MHRDLPIALIDIRQDARAVNETAVEALAASIAAVGLINPIRVRAAGERWEVIAGAHRLAACRSLGLIDITAAIVADDDLHAELAMIDENLCRAELTPSERAQQTARRKAIYLELHPETALGENQHTRVRKVCEGTEAAGRFTAETAKITGRSERAVQLDAERGTIFEEALKLVSGTDLDTGTYLDKLKKQSPSEQVYAVKRDLAHLRGQERERQRAKRDAKVQAGVKARAAKEAAEIIAEHVPGEWWDALKANLYAAGAKHVADAFTNLTGQAIMDRDAA